MSLSQSWQKRELATFPRLKVSRDWCSDMIHEMEVRHGTGRLNNEAQDGNWISRRPSLTVQRIRRTSTKGSRKDVDD